MEVTVCTRPLIYLSFACENDGHTPLMEDEMVKNTTEEQNKTWNNNKTRMKILKHIIVCLNLASIEEKRVLNTKFQIKFSNSSQHKTLAE